jgi:thiol-disulfide isomerase/thioredoxin
MNKIIIGIMVLGSAVLGGWWYLSSQRAMEEESLMEKKVMMEKKTDGVVKDDVIMEKEEDVMMKQEEDTVMKKEEGAMIVRGGQYTLYDASKVAFAKDGKVVLFFRASWCPTCRSLDGDIKANLSQIPQNILILDVDYHKSTDLKKQYGVTYQHTLVQVDASGNMITKWSGSAGLSELLTQVK